MNEINEMIYVANQIIDAKEMCQHNGVSLDGLYDEYSNTTGSEVVWTGDIWNAGSGQWVSIEEKRGFLGWLDSQHG
jgi:hypothetical protein